MTTGSAGNPFDIHYSDLSGWVAGNETSGGYPFWGVVGCHPAELAVVVNVTGTRTIREYPGIDLSAV